MKKTLIASLIGIASVAMTYGQGHVVFSNYLTVPYNQVVWGAGLGAQSDKAVNDFGLQFQLYYGEGVIGDSSLLNAGVIFSLSSSAGATGFDPGMGHGPGGYFQNIIQTLPTWASGDTFTFMYKVITPGYFGQSTLWQETSSIVSTGESPLAMNTVPGLTVLVPEPSTFALAGLGSLALFIFRRRK